MGARSAIGFLMLLEIWVGVPTQVTAGDGPIIRPGNQKTIKGDQLLYQGWAKSHQSNFKPAIKILEEALNEFEKLDDKHGEGKTLANLAWVYYSLGQYQTAIDFYQKAIKIQKKIGDRKLWGEGFSLGGLGLVYYSLGDYRRAINLYEQSLEVARSVSDRQIEAYSMTDLGDAYQAIGEYEKAIEFHQKSIKLGTRYYEGYPYIGLGKAYTSLGNFQLAIESYGKALEFRDRFGNIRAFNGLGNVYQKLQQYEISKNYYSQALFLAKTIEDPAGKFYSLSQIGNLFQNINQPELSIAFYKQSVNIAESIRQDNRKLDRDLQNSYTESVAGTYRQLADLLIQQGRLSEAQAVLELLKLQELREFTRDAKLGIDSPGISISEIEKSTLQNILSQFTTLGNFSQEIAKREREDSPDLKALEKQRDALWLAVNAELKKHRVILAHHYATEPTTIALDKLNAEALRIVNAQPGTVLIYPIVLKDKIQFLLALKAGNGGFIFRPFETKVSAATLFKQIQLFRDQLSKANRDGTPTTDLATIQKTSQKLYEWLLKPLEPELNNANIKHLVIAPDSTTRYIPFAALHDGKQYLVDRFTVSTITAASKTDTTEKMPTPTSNKSQILAMGASIFPTLPPLSNVPAELDAITRTDNPQDKRGIYPGREFLNTTFNYEALQSNLKTGNYRILHLATHGAFRAGRPEDSYLVPGQGINLTTERIDLLGQYGIGNIHLVVLSACETAVGDRASDGMEIPGIGYFFLKNDVKSVMASLWNVNDASTALLMQKFYQNIADGKDKQTPMTKAEALQKVQQGFISGKLTAKDAPARSEADVNVQLEPGVIDRRSSTSNFTHPYYWAPFILIGNSL